MKGKNFVKPRMSVCSSTGPPPVIVARSRELRDFVVVHGGDARLRVACVYAVLRQACLYVRAGENLAHVRAFGGAECLVGGDHGSLRRQRHGNADHEQTCDEATKRRNHGYSG